MEKVKVWISELEFNDNSKIEFDENDIVVFVGANNVGKSAVLKEINKLLGAKSIPTKILKNLEYNLKGSEEDLLNMIRGISKVRNENGQEYISTPGGFSEYSRHLAGPWNSHRGLGNLTKIFCGELKTDERLDTSKPPKNISLTLSPEQHPIHFIQRNDELENAFSKHFKQAFGLDLIVHRNAGDIVPLFVGDRPALEIGEDRVSITYIEKIEKLDRLDEQGDGMRSFVGVLLNSFVGHKTILFIDEPEAFLHPPQARILGKMLAKDLPKGKQLFISTHSEDFLKGLIDACVINLKIVRINRVQNVNHVSVLNNAEIKEVWNDSLLRHSNILNGLFHSKVIICESDSDCRFYSAVLDALFDGTDNISPDVLFTHCGGKHRMPIVIKALSKLNVPVTVVSDFDILNDINPLKDIYENLGGAWAEIENQWKSLKAAIDSKRPELETETFKKEINIVLAQLQDRVVSKEKVSEIQRLLKKTSAWAEAKTVGKSYIPGGDPTQVFNILQEKFKEKGLFIVEVGELEGFVRSIGNHGPKWVNEVLSKDLKNDPELQEARDFVLQLVTS